MRCGLARALASPYIMWPRAELACDLVAWSPSPPLTRASAADAGLMSGIQVSMEPGDMILYEGPCRPEELPRCRILHLPSPPWATVSAACRYLARRRGGLHL